MFSIKCSNVLCLIFSILIISCTKPQSNQNPDCGYTRAFSTKSHILEFPVTITPNQLEYIIGDTMLIDMTFTDSIYDVNIDETFKIEDFPFLPSLFIYRVIDDENWVSGFDGFNEVIIDTTKYEYNVAGGGILPVTLIPKMVYNNEVYEWQFHIVCNTPGRYVMLTLDANDNGNGGGHHEIEDVIKDIDFEGKCYEKSEIANTIKGDDHFDEFLEELIAVDGFYSGNFISIDQDKYMYFNNGGVPLEFSAAYGFEIIE